MGLGSTAKKVSRIADIAEKLYEQLNAVKEQIESLKTQLEDTSDRVDAIDRRSRYNEALLEAIADEQGVDVEAIAAEVEESPAEAPAEDGYDSDPESTDTDS